MNSSIITRRAAFLALLLVVQVSCLTAATTEATRTPANEPGVSAQSALNDRLQTLFKSITDLGADATDDERHHEKGYGTTILRHHSVLMKKFLCTAFES